MYVYIYIYIIIAHTHTHTHTHTHFGHILTGVKSAHWYGSRYDSRDYGSRDSVSRDYGSRDSGSRDYGSVIRAAVIRAAAMQRSIRTDSSRFASAGGSDGGDLTEIVLRYGHAHRLVQVRCPSEVGPRHQDESVHQGQHVKPAQYQHAVTMTEPVLVG